MRTRPFFEKRTFFIGCFLITAGCLFSCHNNHEQKKNRKAVDSIKRIPGTNERIPTAISEKGKILIAYSDCYTCHKEDRKLVGPAFSDIAKRYPANKTFIEMLAHKVINGGSGNWGYPVMNPHPKLSVEEAKMMVSYILSLNGSFVNRL